MKPFERIAYFCIGLVFRRSPGHRRAPQRPIPTRDALPLACSLMDLEKVRPLPFLRITHPSKGLSQSLEAQDFASHLVAAHTSPQHIGAARQSHRETARRFAKYLLPISLA